MTTASLPSVHAQVKTMEPAQAEADCADPHGIHVRMRGQLPKRRLEGGDT